MAELETDDIHTHNTKRIDKSFSNKTSFLTDYLFPTTNIRNMNNRQKRQADQYEYTPTKTRCPLLLVADYRFFQEMGSGNTKTTINYLVNLFVVSDYLHISNMTNAFVSVFIFRSVSLIEFTKSITIQCGKIDR